MAHEKKSLLLGMSFMSARQKLSRDLLFKFAVAAGHLCFRCGRPLARENFSIDHRENWSTAEDPKKTFFDLENVAFSHHDCNSRFTSRLIYKSKEEAVRAQQEKSRLRRRRVYDPSIRASRYRKTGW
jgi:hypothetical protein